MRWAHLLLAGAIAAGCSSRIDGSISPDSLWIRDPAPPAPVVPDGIAVRAVTLNLHGGEEARAARVVEVLSALSPDLVGLQECPEGYAQAIGEGLALSHRAGDRGNVLLSRTPLTSTRTVSLTSGRGFVAARTVIEGAPFSIYVAHIGWNAEGDRQARELIDMHIAPDDSPRLLVMGDFNDEHLSSQADILETVLEDAFTRLGWYPGQRISWPSTGFDGSEGSQLIDLLYYRRAFAPKVLAAGVVNATPVISDHKPAWASLVYPRGDVAFEDEPPVRLALDPAKNRLIDPGAEEDGRGWTPDDGGEIATGPRENQPPHAGAKQFTGASDGFARPTAVSGWSQRVDLSSDRAIVEEGRAHLVVAGWVAVGFRLDVQGEIASNAPRPYDEGEVVVELDDGAGRTLHRWSSGRRDTLKHHPFEARIPVPPGSRGATVRLLSHLKEPSGPSHDAVFDDLFLALEAGDAHGDRGELLRLDGEGAAAFGELAHQADGVPIGIMIYAPRTRSGRGMFRAEHSAVGRAEVPLADAIRFGGWIRTMNATGRGTLAIEIEDDGALWASLPLEPMGAAEWTEVQGSLQIPEGADRLSLVARGEPGGDEVVFFDELVVRPIDPP